VPVHAFYVLNEKINQGQASKEEEKKTLKAVFSKLTVNEGICSFLDIHDEARG
jgi:hypothetical protein